MRTAAKLSPAAVFANRAAVREKDGEIPGQRMEFIAFFAIR
ncbi:hypothetical protein CLOSTASPAR_02487 [[Clostridium] asparagiforme DSM 15981]|uniref:Uncharacterized protein n=1 Tax=[Clostridium] asparagiforme DSM 15981 TaxID=518636 RepID=C0CZR0_9FIRM|nr:hypothetical protein CLOSTASPAR_02487 [[Clostridium] asparagiforme DSM 15981]